jgi:hypothetical protein
MTVQSENDALIDQLWPDVDLDGETDALVNAHASTQQALEAIRDFQGRIGYEIQVRMEGDGATVLDHPTHDVALKEGKVEYVQSILDGILEYVSEAGVISTYALIPEHSEVVPRKWNMTKLKPFAKRGKDIREVIERARSVGRPHLKITLKRRMKNER